jgi:hypothetical protein
VQPARREGLTLRASAEARGLVIGELYGTIAGLRRKGLVPTSTRGPLSKFLALGLRHCKRLRELKAFSMNRPEIFPPRCRSSRVGDSNCTSVMEIDR